MLLATVKRPTLLRFDEEYGLVREAVYWAVGITEWMLFDFCPADRRHREESDVSALSMRIWAVNIRMLTSFPFE